MEGILVATTLYLLEYGKSGFEVAGFAANGFGKHSPGEYNIASAFVIKLVITFILLFITLGSTYSKAPEGFAGIAIGLALTLIHLISIPVTFTTVNPSRSTNQAIFAEDG